MDVREWLEKMVEVDNLDQNEKSELINIGRELLQAYTQHAVQGQSPTQEELERRQITPQELPIWLAIPFQEYIKETHPRVKLHWMLDTVEVAIRWVVAIAIAELRSEEGHISDEIQRRLKQNIERPTLGVWVGMLRSLSELGNRKPTPLTNIFTLYNHIIAQNFQVDGNQTAQTSVLVLRNQVAHSGGLSTQHSDDLLQHHNDFFLNFMQSVSALTAQLGIYAQHEGRVYELKGLQPSEPPTNISADELKGVCLTSREAPHHTALCLDPLVTWGPLKVMGQDGLLHQPRDGVVAQVYARANKKSLSYTALGRDEAHSESDDIKSFRRLFGLDRSQAEPAHRIAQLEARESLTPQLIEREAPKRLIRNWLRDTHRDLDHQPHLPRIGWVGAEAGLGKTVLISQIVSDLSGVPNLYYHHFERGDERNNLHAFLKLLREALWAWGELQQHTSPPDAQLDDIEELTEDVLERLKSVSHLKGVHPNAPSPKMRVIIDGVDALSASDELFTLIRRLNQPRVLWLISGRQLTPPLPPAERALIFGPQGLPKLSLQEVRAMLTLGLEQAKYKLLSLDHAEGGDEMSNRYVERVAQQAQGLPLYVQLLIDDLRRGHLDISESARLPNGIKAYYAELASRVGTGDQNIDLTLLICLLACSEEPMSARDIQTFFEQMYDHEHHKMETTQAYLEQLLFFGGELLRSVPRPDGAEEGYTLYHHGFRDYVNETASLARSRARVKRLLLKLSREWRSLPEGHFRDHILRWGAHYAVVWSDQGDVPGGLPEALKGAETNLTSFEYQLARAAALPPNDIRAQLKDYDTLLERLSTESTDTLRAWRNFMYERVHILTRGTQEWGAEKILLQQAVEYADQSPVTESAEAWLRSKKAKKLLWLRRLERPAEPLPSACLKVFEGHSRQVDGALLVDSERALSWSLDCDLKLWRLEDGKHLKTLSGHTDRVHGALMINEKHALSYSSDGSIRVWDVEQGVECHQDQSEDQSHSSEVLGVALWGGTQALSWSKDKTIRLWAIHQNKLERLADYKTGQSYPRSLVTLSEERFAYCDVKRIHIITAHTLKSTQSLKKVLTLTGHTDEITGLLTVGEGESQRLLSWSKDKTLRCWDITSEEPTHVTLEGHIAQVSGALELMDGRIFSWSSDSADPHPRLWSFEGRVWACTLLEEMSKLKGATLRTDGALLTYDSKGVIQLWSPQLNPVASLSGHSQEVKGALSLPAPLGEPPRLLSWSTDKTLRSWSCSPELLEELERINSDLKRAPAHQSFINGVEPLPRLPGLAPPSSSDPLGDHAYLSWSSDGTAKVWFNAVLQRTLEHPSDVKGVRVSSTGERALSWCGEHILRVWDLNTGEQGAEMKGHQELIQGALFTPDGEGALSWSSDKSLRLWDLTTGAERVAFMGHTQKISGVMMCGDTHFLSWSSDKTLKLWALDGRLVCDVSPHESQVIGVYLSGHHLISWSKEALELWRLDEDPQGALSGLSFVHRFEEDEGSVKSAVKNAVITQHDDRACVIAMGQDDLMRVWDLERAECLEELTLSDVWQLRPSLYHAVESHRKPHNVVGDHYAVTSAQGVKLMTLSAQRPPQSLYWHDDQGLRFMGSLTSSGQILMRGGSAGRHLSRLQLYKGATPVTLDELI